MWNMKTIGFVIVILIIGYVIGARMPQYAVKFGLA